MLLGTAKLGMDGDKGDGVVALTGLSAAIVSVPAPGTAGIMGRVSIGDFLRTGAVARAETRVGAGAQTRSSLYIIIINRRRVYFLLVRFPSVETTDSRRR